MKNTSDRPEAVQEKVVFVAEELVHRAADRVGPLAQSAADWVGPIAEAAADRIGAVADKVSPLAHTAAERLTPMAQSAAGRVGPLTHTAADRLAPLVQSASDRVTPLAAQAAGYVFPYATRGVAAVTPLAQRGRDAVGPLAHRGVNAVSPYAQQAIGLVAPAVGAARGRVSDDLLPKLNGAFTAAANAPLVIGATTRGRAALAAARGGQAAPPELELELAPEPELVSDLELVPEPELVPVPELAPELALQEKGGSPLKWVLIIAGVVAIAVLVARKFLGSKDSDWQAARPSTPYAPPTPTEDFAAADVVVDLEPVATVHDSATAVEPAPGAASEPFGVAGPESGATASYGAAEVTNVTEPSDDQDPAEVAPPIVVADFGLDPEVDHATYSGDGVYVGSQPPEGFTIKGNERSMKYHLPESAGWTRTIAEVWFSSEEAAQANGFIRAQR